MLKNESELIKNSQQRQLTAKALKFKWQCIDIIANQHGFNKYSIEIKPIKEKFSTILDFLIIDKKLTIEQIKTMIKNRKITLIN